MTSLRANFLRLPRLGTCRALLAAFWTAVGSAVGLAAEPGDHFELKVRPILSRRCFHCHGPDQQESKLRLDSRAGMLKGGERGPAIDVANLPRSRLLAAIRREGALKMPGDGQLAPEEIAVLTQWVLGGAPWPESKAGSAEKKLWSLEPIAAPPVPELADAKWCQNEIDHFILTKLREKKLTPSPRADRRTLIRRASFDLTGLPPEAKDLAAFVEDSRPDAEAFAEVVERLLASPRYGERWGRHWLDIARYADTPGSSNVDIGFEESVYPYAFTYRDYVIEAYNRDLPYDQFVREQIAADLIPAGRDMQVQRALGFLTVGRRDKLDLHEVMDDRIDTVTRGLMGMTVQCSRCHDHKTDPIPTEDYYALYGVFASTYEPDPLPVVPRPPDDQTRDYDQKRQPLDAARNRFIDGKVERTTAELRARRAEYLAATRDLEKPGGDLLQIANDRRLDWRLLKHVAAATANLREKDELEIPVPDASAIPDLLTDEELSQLAAIDKQLAELEQKHPGAPWRAMVLRELPRPFEGRVFLRGAPENLGPYVPRQFLTALSGSERKPFTQGSGRLELAEAILATDNPLTARVFVNHAWLKHFGRGLVPTASNFGLSGSPPTHPELLDYLASRFRDGWHVKSLHRAILNSATYAQGSADRPASTAIDPGNMWFWRFPSRYLEYEAIRDAMLAVAGELDPKIGGPSVAGPSRATSQRRTMYLFIDRVNIDPVARIFNFPVPKTTVAERFQAIVPQQTLFLMNDPFVLARANAIAAHPGFQAEADEARRVGWLYESLFSRQPTAKEMAESQRYLGGAADAARWTQLVHALLMTNEFAYLD